MENDNYQPISCSDYDIYEIAIMRGQSLELSWLDDRGQHQQGVFKPLNLHIREGAEFLVVETDSGMKEMRLDKIKQASAVT